VRGLAPYAISATRISARGALTPSSRFTGHRHISLYPGVTAISRFPGLRRSADGVPLRWSGSAGGSPPGPWRPDGDADPEHRFPGRESMGGATVALDNDALCDVEAQTGAFAHVLGRETASNARAATCGGMPGPVSPTSGPDTRSRTGRSAGRITARATPPARCAPADLCAGTAA